MTLLTSPDAASRKALIIANIVMLSMILVHDLDHLRQSFNWCYTIPLRLWIINISVYVPNFIALALANRSQRYAAPITAFGALLTAIAFTKVHLWKPLFNIWGIWNSTFLQLGADWISWTILALLVLVSVGVAMVATWSIGRSGQILATR